LPAHKVQVITNGSSRLIPKTADPAVKALRRDLCGDGELVVGTVGMLRPKKRVDLVLDAFDRIRREFPTARLVIVGDGPELPELRTRAERGLGDVRFLGHREDVGALLASFDLFVMASEVEGSPLALIEAMRAGLGIVATRVGGIPDTAPDGECALLVPPGDAAGLSAAMARLLHDGQLRTSLGQAARTRAESLFGWERVVDEWSALFERVVEERRRRRSGPSG
jgi:glycosyltransferase involved in cell wall biosynthesis